MFHMFIESKGNWSWCQLWRTILRGVIPPWAIFLFCAWVVASLTWDFFERLEVGWTSLFQRFFRTGRTSYAWESSWQWELKQYQKFSFSEAWVQEWRGSACHKIIIWLMNSRCGRTILEPWFACSITMFLWARSFAQNTFCSSNTWGILGRLINT